MDGSKMSELQYLRLACIEIARGIDPEGEPDDIIHLADRLSQYTLHGMASIYEAEDPEDDYSDDIIGAIKRWRHRAMD